MASIADSKLKEMEAEMDRFEQEIALPSVLGPPPPPPALPATEKTEVPVTTSTPTAVTESKTEQPKIVLSFSPQPPVFTPSAQSPSVEIERHHVQTVPIVNYQPERPHTQQPVSVANFQQPPPPARPAIHFIPHQLQRQHPPGMGILRPHMMSPGPGTHLMHMAMIHGAHMHHAMGPPLGGPMIPQITHGQFIPLTHPVYIPRSALIQPGTTAPVTIQAAPALYTGTSPKPIESGPPPLESPLRLQPVNLPTQHSLPPPPVIIPPPIVSLPVITPIINGTDDQSKKKEKKKKYIRTAGGQTWEDPQLAEWNSDDFRIFCGDLGNEVNDEILARAFSKFPSFLKARVIRDKRTNKTKGYGFVSFKDPQDFVKAMKEMNGKYVGSRPIKLRKSSWKDRNIEIVRKKMKEKQRLGLR